MIQLGEKQTLVVKRIKQAGAYLGLPGEDNDVLLPGKYVSEDVQPGDEMEVFIYRDSSDRLIATTLQPALALGKTAILRVSDAGKIGAFLDWGLEKDLLLPFTEQTVKPVEKDSSVLVALYVDKSSRLCATMKVYEYLRCDSHYEKGDSVRCIIYQFNSKYGAFAAVDGMYHAMIPRGKYSGSLKIGDIVEARVEKVREDGKLELTLHEPIREQIALDSAKVMALLDSYDGVLPFTEKASPEVIERELDMSKAAFKRAIGNLLKSSRISTADGKIRRLSEEETAERLKARRQEKIREKEKAFADGTMTGREKRAYKRNKYSR